ncbi:UV excision repair protein RAD23 homolog B [Sabethes cyaneus]|uniref:UV excision repair protein RAD23 homolog B n=1 Tax=Sabethes cyaneus TaxID=53552 RepID=UPI00221E2A0E|nr:UV excision repair protein RAD23 homolog B [Sabethes cyaneus]XP_053691476.1 UV excision repair protein RAD23 homolog B [Sabethes cyaneus]
MKITIKTLKQEAFHIEVDVEKDTVRTLKEKFFQESKDYPVERQRLIYLGKIMEDEHPLSQYNLDDKKFVVVMNKKPTTAPAEPATAAAAATTGAASSAPSTAAAAAAPVKTEASAVSSAAAAAAADKPKEEEKPKEESKPDETQQDDLQVKILRITEMGYSEEEARIALEICDNNPDRAVEYLLSEIATSSMGGSGIGGGGGGGNSGGSAASGLLGTGGSQESRLAFLREHPTFLEMKRLLQEDPNLLPHLLQKIQSSNPDLMRIISENQMEFLTLVNEGADGPEGRSAVPRELETTAAAMVDSLSQADMDAIDRLKALGYPEHLVIQAYIACERNEYQAADFLVSQNPDDDD